MPTTGNYYSYSVAVSDIIRQALLEIKYLDPTATPTAQDTSDCLLRLNMWLSFLSTQGMWLWTFDQLILPLATNQTTYTIGPGGYLNTYRPLRIMDGTFIRYLLNAQAFDTPIRVISRQEYDQFGAKTTLGIVNSVYYDNQTAPYNTLGTGAQAYNPNTPLGILSVYPTPSDGTRQLFLQVQRPIQGIVAVTDNFDVSPEMYRLLYLGLANEVKNMYETPDDLCKRVENNYEKAFVLTTGWSQTEQTSVFFAPNTSQYNRKQR